MPSFNEIDQNQIQNLKIQRYKRRNKLNKEEANNKEIDNLKIFLSLKGEISSMKRNNRLASLKNERDNMKKPLAPGNKKVSRDASKSAGSFASVVQQVSRIPKYNPNKLKKEEANKKEIDNFKRFLSLKSELGSMKRNNRLTSLNNERDNMKRKNINVAEGTEMKLMYRDNIKSPFSSSLISTRNINLHQAENIATTKEKPKNDLCENEDVLEAIRVVSTANAKWMVPVLIVLQGFIMYVTSSSTFGEASQFSKKLFLCSFYISSIILSLSC